MSRHSRDIDSRGTRRRHERPQEDEAPIKSRDKENNPSVSPLSRLAESVENSRRWAPVLDPWHNHCEWLVHRHRKLRRRFRRTTAADRLSGVLTTLKCTRERRRGANREGPAVGSGWSYEQSSCVDYPTLEPANAWLGSVRQELVEAMDTSTPAAARQPLTIDPVIIGARDASTGIGDRVSERETEPDNEHDSSSSRSPRIRSADDVTERTPERRKTRRHSRSARASPDASERTFAPDEFRTSTPNASDSQTSDRDDEGITTDRRSSAWKDYVMSHDPILFRQYVDARFPEKSWRHAHQKIVTRHARRPKQSRRLRKPPTPKCLKVSWTSLDDVVQMEGILRSPIRLSPVLPRDDDAGPSDPELPNENIDHGEARHGDGSVDDEVTDIIGEGIRAIRKECLDNRRGEDESRDTADGNVVDETLLSDISLGTIATSHQMSDISLGESDLEEGEIRDNSDKDDAMSEDDIDDICRIVDKELNHYDHGTQGLLSETSNDILDDLSNDSQYPPNFFKPDYADRASRARNRKFSNAARQLDRLDPKARSFKPTSGVGEDQSDRRIVQYADRRPTEGNVKATETPKVECAEGTKFYPSDIRFYTDSGKAGSEEQELDFIQPDLVKIEKSDAQDSILKLSTEKKLADSCVCKGDYKETVKETLKEEGNFQQEVTMDGKVVGNRLQAKGHNVNDKTEKVSNIPDAKTKIHALPGGRKGKTQRQTSHNIPVVMGRRPWKASKDWEKPKGAGSGQRQISWTPGSGDDDNGGVVTQRIPQLRRIVIQQGDAATIHESSSDAEAGCKCHIAEATTEEAIRVVEESPMDTEPKDDGKTNEQTLLEEARRYASLTASLSQQKVGARGIEMTSNRHQAVMRERLAILKQSYGNHPVVEAVPVKTTVGECSEKVITEKDVPPVDPEKVNRKTENNIRRTLNPKDRVTEREDLKKETSRSAIVEVEKEDGSKRVKNKQTNVRTSDQNGPSSEPQSHMPVPQELPPLRKTDTEKPREKVEARVKPLISDNQPPQPLLPDPRQLHHQAHHQHHHQQRMPLHPQQINHHPGTGGLLPFNNQHHHQQLMHHQRGPHPMNAMSAYQQQHHIAMRMAAANQYYNHQHQMFLRHHMLRAPPGFLPHHPSAGHMINGHPGLRPGFRMPRPSLPQQQQQQHPPN